MGMAAASRAVLGSGYPVPVHLVGRAASSPCSPPRRLCCLVGSHLGDRDPLVSHAASVSPTVDLPAGLLVRGVHLVRCTALTRTRSQPHGRLPRPRLPCARCPCWYPGPYPGSWSPGCRAGPLGRRAACGPMQLVVPFASIAVRISSSGRGLIHTPTSVFGS
ncbi:unnamed protein product [Calypogeia fissa]